MVRHLLVPALLAVLFAPDWASAFDPCVCPPPVVVSPCPPVGGVIVYSPIVRGSVVHCPPAVGTIAPQKGPSIVPERTEEPKKPQVTADPPKMMPAKAEEPIDPKPAPLPVFKPQESKPVEPVPARPVEPKPEAKQVVPPAPAPDRIQTPAVPAMPPARPAPKPDLGKMDFEIPPIGDAPLAKPQPATSEAPKPPADKPTEKPKGQEKLPKFDFELPKVDSGMAQPVEANKMMVSNSSPLVDKLAEVDVFPRDGKNVMSAKRGVTFVNKSARDILLTVEGQTVTLPSKMVMTAELPVAFKWQIGGGVERTERVPDGSPGIDVVIRK